MNARFRSADGKTVSYVNTLNGSFGSRRGK